jgi:glycosyltransferase involved in cell wall biosynthesis
LTNGNEPELSIVIPAFNEAGNLSRLYELLKSTLSGLDLSWELVFADDGSLDDTWGVIEEIHQSDSSVKGVRLSRNFGHQYALFAGLCHASGKAVITMDADLQHPPEVIPEMVRRWQDGFKIVNTVRLDPKDYSASKKFFGRAFYRLFSLLSGVKLEYGMADFRLLDRQVVNEILQFREEGLFLRGLVKWVGYKDTSVEFHGADRFSGTTKYSLAEMFKFGWHGISSFSIVPLRIGIGLGVLTSLASFYFLADAFYEKMVSGTAVPGWASTVGVISLLFGILFIFLGLLGEYIGRILEQVRDRPLFIVADSLGVERRKDRAN